MFRRSRCTSRTVAVLAALAVFAGCSGASQTNSAVPAALRGFESPPLPQHGAAAGFLDAKGARLVFVSQPFYPIEEYNVGGVYVFPQRGHNPPALGLITNVEHPLGVAVDKAGRLYVANSTSLRAYGGAVNIYGPPYTNDYVIGQLQLPNSSLSPVGIAVSRTGTVAVVSNCATSSCNAEVVFYASWDAQGPCATVSSPVLFSTYGSDAFDDKGTLFVQGSNKVGQSTVGQIAGGCSATGITQLPIRGLDAGGLQIDHSGNLALLDLTSKAVDTYKPGKWKRISSAPLSGSEGPVNFAFSGSGKYLYTADNALDVSQEYAYPKGGSVKNTLNPNPSGTPSPGGFYGVAVTR